VPTPVVAIFGPTGVGKTAVALSLADLLRGRGEDPVAISADALQVYRGLETLTGVATAEEQARLEHRLLSFVPVTEGFSVGTYMPLAHAEIDRAVAAGRRPIVVGGTGLYLRAALAELSMRKAGPQEESELWSDATRHPTLLCGLLMERRALYAAIEARVDAMKQRSRNYARRQLTWMRKMAGVQTIDVTRRDAADVAAEIGRRLVTGREVS